MRFLVTSLHYFVLESDEQFNTTQHYLQFIAWAEANCSPVQFLIFNLWSLANKIAEVSKRTSKLFDPKCEFAPINSGLIIYYTVIFISCYQLLFIYCMHDSMF